MADLQRPAKARALILMAHGSGSGRFSPRNRMVAALTAAALRRRAAGAVVSRGGRPDLAPAALPLLRCPLLLIVGERDREVLRCNQRTALSLRAPHRLVQIPGAGHLFEEPGALQAVAELGVGWFADHLDSLAGKGTSHFHISG